MLKQLSICCLIACIGKAFSKEQTKIFYLDGYGDFYPPMATNWEEWWHAALAFKENALKVIKYNDQAYKLPQLDWAKTSILTPQVMIHEPMLFDRATGKYTVSKFLDDLNDRYGGVDAVLVWYPYPNLGVDDRNQWDFFRALPGGQKGTEQMVADFHAHNVSVLFPYNPWDTGTRDEGRPISQSIAELFSSVNADGCNLDTVRPSYGSSYDLWNDAMKLNHPLAFQPEWNLNYYDIEGGSHKDLMYNVVAWGEKVEDWPYYWHPMGSTGKLLEQRHMHQLVDRWSKNQTTIMQYAFVMGCAYVSWENVWGTWNGFPPRTAEALRRWATIARVAAPLTSNMVGDGVWFPYVPAPRQDGVWTSLFQGTLPGVSGMAYYWPVVNRVDADYTSNILEVPYFEGYVYLDLYHGTELEVTPERNGNTTLHFDLEGLGYGAVLAIDGSQERPAFIQSLMSKMQRMTVVRLKTFSEKFEVLTQKMVEIPATPRVAACPVGTVVIPAGTFKFYSIGTMIEGVQRPGVGTQMPWETEPSQEHYKVMDMPSFCMDKFLVTNSQYQEFQHLSGYVPDDESYFLNGWTKNYTKYYHPEGTADVPVSWVNLDDVRAYTAWKGCRLPHEWEWQYAAQGSVGNRTYPWGDNWAIGAAPIPDTGRNMRGADPTNAHPEGASPFGVEDLVGNLHQWTDEYYDEHTRSAVTKGGSYYFPQAPSDGQWYYPQGKKVFQYNKFLLFAPGLDRSGGIGFRCMVDMMDL